LDFLIPMLSKVLAGLSVTDVVILAVNLFLLIVSSWLFRWLHQFAVKEEKRFLNYFRVVNVLCIVLILFNRMFLSKDANNHVINIVAALLISYAAVLAYQVTAFFLQARFGKLREGATGPVSHETYHSRVLKILSGILIFILAVIAIVQTLGFSSLLQAGGVLGFLGVFLALTQGSWAPDLIGGLILLNSNIFEEGDVLEITNGGGTICVLVFRTKLFHTELLNVVDNHRVMISNSKIREFAVHNLSKFASAKGLRENLRFNIAYGTDANAIRELFSAALEDATQGSPSAIESQYAFEARVIATGDDAVEWALYYYTKDVKNLYRTRQLLREAVLKLSAKRDISLATPRLLQVNNVKN
jgi:small-conductance mechanosensitive channel